jgi:hypothetical protein
MSKQSSPSRQEAGGKTCSLPFCLASLRSLRPCVERKNAPSALRTFLYRLAEARSTQSGFPSGNVECRSKVRQAAKRRETTLTFCLSAWRLCDRCAFALKDERRPGLENFSLSSRGGAEHAEVNMRSFPGVARNYGFLLSEPGQRRGARNRLDIAALRLH